MKQQIDEWHLQLHFQLQLQSRKKQLHSLSCCIVSYLRGVSEVSEGVQQAEMMMKKLPSGFRARAAFPLIQRLFLQDVCSPPRFSLSERLPTSSWRRPFSSFSPSSLSLFPSPTPFVGERERKRKVRGRRKLAQMRKMKGSSFPETPRTNGSRLI